MTFGSGGSFLELEGDRYHWQSDATGPADALLFDEQGLLGRTLQTQVLRVPR